jgi:hypothetical protein
MFELYDTFTNTQKNTFADICNKLLANTYLARDKRDNKEAYYFVVSYKDLFEEYFKMMNMQLVLNRDLGTITLENTNTVRFTAANGKYILMPLAGFAKEDGSFKNVGDCGYYWTNAISNNTQAVDLIFKETFSGAEVLGLNKGNRFCGLSIRPVLP